MTAASWTASSARGPVAWLSLDDSDNNPRSFWSNLVSALVASGAVRDRSPLRYLNPVSQFGDADLDELWVQLADLPAPVVLVIDDFHVITDDEVLEQFGRFIAKLPPSPLRLVLLAHADPVLPLHELRARGDLTEIRAADLAFTSAETAELFASSAFRLRAGQLDRIMGRTEGWPAGVRVAALSIDPQDVESGITRFCSADRGVADYFVDEVLQAVSPADRDFLLRTTVTEMMNGDVADQLTGRSDGRQTLERLFESNIFTVKGEHGWYSYQPLLRRLLTNLPDLTLLQSAVDPLRVTRWTATDNGARLRGDGPSLIAQQQRMGDMMTSLQAPSDSEVRAVEDLIRRLVARFPDVPADSVRQIVNASWDTFTDKPIRDFVPVLVERSAHEQLRSRRAR